jgi:hypothetical protein
MFAEGFGDAMTGKELARAIEKHKGIVFVPAAFPNDPYIQAVKKDLISYFAKKGDDETGLTFTAYSSRAYVTVDPSV